MSLGCDSQNMKTSIINGSEVSRLSVAIQLLPEGEPIKSIILSQVITVF